MLLAGSLRHVSQEELIKGCLAGNTVYQKAIYDHISAKMFGVCLRYASDYHTAEDILQEGFIKIFKNLNKFRGDGSFEGWARRIIVNTAIEFYRKKVYVQPIEDKDNHKYGYAYEDVVSEMSAKEIMEAVQQLAPGYRTIFNLYVIEGYNHREIGELLGINEGTSKSQLARARKILMKEIMTNKKVTLTESER